MSNTIGGGSVYGYQTQQTCGSCDVDYADAIAHWAKREVLKEKVKQRIEAKYGKKLDKIADLIVEMVAESAQNAEEAEKRDSKLAKAFEDIEGAEE